MVMTKRFELIAAVLFALPVAPRDARTQDHPPAVLFHGDGSGLLVRSPEEEEWLLVERLAEHREATNDRGGGGAVSELETTQVLYSSPAFGEPSNEGNGVLLQWSEDGTENGSITVRLNGQTLCTVPPLSAPGTNACVVSGLTRTCRPDIEPGCVPNLGGEVQCRVPEETQVNAHIFEIVRSTGETLRQCQEVVDTWPFGSSMLFAYRRKLTDRLAVDLTSGRCDVQVDLLAATNNCNFAAAAGDSDIIVTGNNGGPPATYLDISLDGLPALHIEEPGDLFCFDRPLPVPTRGQHELKFSGYLSRPQAADTFWFNAETNQFYARIVGSFYGLNLTTGCVTTTSGRPRAPESLVLRQVTHGAGATVRATWVNAERPYTGGIRVSLDGKATASLSGDAEAALLTGLAAGKRTVGVRGDGGAAGLSDETTSAITVKAQSPVPNGNLPAVQCSFDLAGARTALVTWAGGDPVAWVDVTRRRAAGGSYELAAWGPGSTGQLALAGAAKGDLLRVELFRKDGTGFYLAGVVDCSAPEDTGRILPGDVNQDRKIDIGDAIGLLVVLFRGAEGVALPCTGNVDGAGGKKLLDWDGNQTLNVTDTIGLLRYLFLGDSPHILGKSCAPVGGCQSSCGE